MVFRCWGLGQENLMPQTPRFWYFQNTVSRAAIIFLPAFFASGILSSACGLMAAPSGYGSILDEETDSAESRMPIDEEPAQTHEHGAVSSDSPVETVSPRPSGIYHKLKRGETLSSLSRSYQVPLEILMRANRISDAKKIRAGASIFIPGPPEPASPPVEDLGMLSWPLQGKITSKFGPRDKRLRLHEGIDIDGHGGDEIRAAAAGTVVHAGPRGKKYGRIVLLDHGDGLQTLYAHVGKLMVRIGDRIERSDPIAEVGRSGNARGTHLHFEVHHNGQPVDPMGYLQTDVLVSSQP